MACTSLVTIRGTGKKNTVFYLSKRVKNLNPISKSVFFTSKLQNFKTQKLKKTPFFANFLGEEGREEGVGVTIIVIGGLATIV